MSDVVAISAEGVRWLNLLARAHETGDGWDASEPYAAYQELLAVGAIEYRPAAFRLSDIGFWLMNRVVAEGEES